MGDLMNIVDILILGVLAISVIAGMYRGFLASGLHTAGFIGAWFAAKATYEQLSTAILSNRSLMGVLSNYLEAENFFPNLQVANMTVSEALSSGQMENIAKSVGEGIPFIADAFLNNVQSFAFSNLGISTLADYLDQTVWVGLFNVMAFLAIFALSYAVIVLVVNLFNHVFSFPALRWFDRLLGGVFGLVRGAVVALLAVILVPMVLEMFAPDLLAELIADSQLYSYFTGIDLLKIQAWISQLLAG